MTDYQWYKSKGICPQCRNAEAAYGHTLCPECIYKKNLRNIAADPEKKRASNRASYAKHRENGKCIQCGKPAIQGQCRCEKCALKNRIRAKRYVIRSVKIENGICRWCDKPVVKGYKYCEEHLEKMRETGRKNLVFAREALKKIQKEDPYCRMP